jgi:hypothetical protein
MANHIPKSILINTENALGSSEAMVNSILLQGSTQPPVQRALGTKEMGLKLTIHLHPVPRLRTEKAIRSPPLSSWHDA